MPTKEDTLVLKTRTIHIPKFEKIVEITEKQTNLRAIIAIHSSKLGPALGGTRMFPYRSFDEGLNDVLRLAHGMSSKFALAGCDLGGGKSVIFGDPRKDKSKDLFYAFGKAVEKFKGSYICAQDSGVSQEDLHHIRAATRYLVGIEKKGSSGDPAPFTAWGTFRGIQACMQELYGSDDVTGKVIAVQGLGAVGSLLCKLLFWHGARLCISDIDQEKVQKIAQLTGAMIIDPIDILSTPCDVLSPCALGNVLNTNSLLKINCHAIAGCANNQLLHSSCAKDLKNRGILYAPDYIINAGGAINVTCELEEQGYHPQLARDHVDTIYSRLLQIFKIAKDRGISTEQAAQNIAKYKLDHASKRMRPVVFHH